MRELNLKHLHYFWVVAQEGSISAASERLFITPQTISAQLRELEERMHCKLFERRGRGLVLTRAGETARGYADAIFDLSRELTNALSEEEAGLRQVRIGVVDVVPKLIASLVLLPLLRREPAPRLQCREGDAADMLNRLAQHRLDAVLSDHPATPDPNVRLYTHELGRTGISFLGAPGLLAEPLQPFPRCLHGLPILLPGRRTALRMALENWLREQGVEMRVAGECDDSALIKALGQAGGGIFTCPTAIESEVCRQYAVEAIGRTEAVQEQFFLITASSQVERPLLAELIARARGDVFEARAGSD